MKVKANIKINEWSYDIEGDTNDVMVTFKNHSGTPTKTFLTINKMKNQSLLEAM